MTLALLQTRMELAATSLPVAWGDYALLGVVFAVGAVLLLALVYLANRRAELVRAMRALQVVILGLLGMASWVLLDSLLNDNFKLSYVAAHSEKTLASFYKVAAFWAGQEGSLLLWALMLGVMSALMAWRLRKLEDGFAVLTLAVMSAVTGFFTCVMLFSTHGNPFAPAEAGRAMGMGLNPALQNLAMVFHPPMLFLGYAGFTAPFAYLVAGLLTRNQNWIYFARPWMVYSWIVLTVGILLGAQWAYVELGWGGYWAWDPVENASLLPWLTGTALLHSAILQVRRGMFKRWTAGLTAASFFLCILGTYLTRSGVIQSVHAFEQSDIGYYFLALLGAILAGSIAVIGVGVWRRQLDAEHPLEALVSREGFFLIGNVLLVIMTVTTVVGTLYPLISGTVGTPVTVSGPFYNKVILPMALLLAALMSTGPVLGSGAGALDRARGKLGGMLIAGVALAGLIFMLGYDSLWALGAAVTVGAVMAGFAMDVTASLKAGHSVTRVIAARHRHWGAQLAHLGLAAVVAGIAGSSLYGVSKTVQLHPGPVAAATRAERTVGGYVLELAGVAQERRPNHMAVVATVNLTSVSGQKFTLKPERRFYDQDPQQGATEVALRMGLLSDVYMTLAGSDETTVSVTTLLNPLVNWIWIGGALLTLGGLVCLIPGKQDALPATSPALPATQPAAAPVRKGKNKRERRQARAFNHNAINAGRRS